MNNEKIQQKLEILADAAKFDVSCASSGSNRKNINNGISICDSGTIYKTTNNGSNWNIVYLNKSLNLNKIAFSDSLHGSVIGDNGVILTTTNYGNNWINQNVQTSSNLLS